MDKIKTGQLIKDARNKKGYTQQELGDIVGVTNKAVSRWENGESFPDVAVLESLAAALDIKIDELIIGESVPKESIVLKDAISILKLQRREKKRYIRSVIGILVCAVLMILRVYISGFSSHVGFQIPLWVDAFLLVICVSIILIVGIIRKESVDSKYNNIYKKVMIVWYISAIYAPLLFGYLLIAAANRKFLFGLKESQIGPFIFNQLRVIMVISLIAVLFLLYRNLIGEKIPYNALIVVAILFENCDLTDMLFNVISLEAGIRGFIFVAVTYIVIILMLLIPLRLLINKKYK